MGALLTHSLTTHQHHTHSTPPHFPFFPSDHTFPLTHESVHLVRVARVVRDTEGPTQDGKRLLSKGSREEAQLVQQAAQGLAEGREGEGVKVSCLMTALSSLHPPTVYHTTSTHTHTQLSKRLLTPPLITTVHLHTTTPTPSSSPSPSPICPTWWCTVQVHHLWGAVVQGRESLYLILTLLVAQLLRLHLTDVAAPVVTQHKNSLPRTNDVLNLEGRGGGGDKEGRTQY